MRGSTSWAALVFVWLPSAAAAAQVGVGDVVEKDVLTRSIPTDPRLGARLELKRATTGELTTMRPRFENGELRGGVTEQREAFITLHARPSVGGGMFDRGAASVRGPDGRFTVLQVAETELGFVERLETLRPPSTTSHVSLLHVRYAQTGSGGVTEDLLFALGPEDRLVEVPIEAADLGDVLLDGEYLCCGRFTSFDDDLIELTVYVTKDGRNGVTHAVRVRFELEGRFRRDPAEQSYVPDFRLRAVDRTGREPLESRGP